MISLQVGVEEYNITKRGFLNALDTNHHGVVHQLMDQSTKHVEHLNFLVVRHGDDAPS